MVIFKVIPSYKDWEELEKINKIIGGEPFDTEHWCDKYEFEEKPDLKNFIEEEEFQAIQDGTADYVAFRLDD